MRKCHQRETKPSSLSFFQNPDCEREKNYGSRKLSPIYVGMKRNIIILLISLLSSLSLYANPCSNGASPQMARFQNSLDSLESILKDSIDGNSLNFQSLKKARVPLFYLESLGRLYRDMPKGGKRIGKFFDDIKDLEDAIGAFDLRTSLLEEAISLKLSSSKIIELEAQVEETKKALAKLLKTRDWSDGKRLEKIRKQLNKIKWPNSNEDTLYLNSTIKESVIKLQDKIDSELAPLIRKKDYDYEALELGLHEFRRGIRWIALYLQAAKDVYALKEVDPSTLNEKDLDVYNTYHDNKYAQLGNSKSAKILIPQVPYLYLTKFIHLIGEIKDKGERNYYLGKQNQEHGVEREAFELFEEFQKIAPLLQLIKEL